MVPQPPPGNPRLRPISFPVLIARMYGFQNHCIVPGAGPDVRYSLLTLLRDVTPPPEARLQHVCSPVGGFATPRQEGAG